MMVMVMMYQWRLAKGCKHFGEHRQDSSCTMVRKMQGNEQGDKSDPLHDLKKKTNHENMQLYIRGEFQTLNFRTGKKNISFHCRETTVLFLKVARPSHTAGIASSSYTMILNLFHLYNIKYTPVKPGLVQFPFIWGISY